MKQEEQKTLQIPNKINALPVRRPGPIIAGVIVGILACLFVGWVITNPRFEWNIVWKYLFNENVIAGIWWTLCLTALSMIIAIILSIILAMMRQSTNPVLRSVSWFYIWFFRGTPIYTQLVFWGLFSVLVPKFSIGIPFTNVEFWSINSADVINAFYAAVIGLALNEAAYLSEIVRAGIEAVDNGQEEAAKALGMSHAKMMRRIILPQAMRIIVPPISNEVISMLKTTSLVMAVPFTLDLQFASNAIANRIYKPIPLLLVASFWYLLITTILMIIQSQLERYFGKGFESQPLSSKIDTDRTSIDSYNVKEQSEINKKNDARLLGLNA
ncbi:MAG: amino acid ABC transporter permease [Bifidobacteriaceae bacterium]|nr:amino acid ABC transporter permease [Bifidobacteriaceae bacterium]